MLVTFRSTESGQLVMFGDVAAKLLRMMGTHGKPKGALSAADIPAAVEALQSALASAQGVDAPESNDDEGEPPVGLRQRAVPLIDFLRRSATGGAPVMWDHN